MAASVFTENPKQANKAKVRPAATAISLSQLLEDIEDNDEGINWEDLQQPRTPFEA